MTDSQLNAVEHTLINDAHLLNQTPTDRLNNVTQPAEENYDEEFITPTKKKAYNKNNN